ncbi:MAG: hypothetical protein R3315_01740 [Woeseiaceae bacterium]|nr:hypothetical protein [Woeseiaceae bacterium]
MSDAEPSLRLGKKYAPRSAPEVDVPGLYAEQSVTRAVGGGLLASLILIIVWTYAGLLWDRFFPWYSVLQGIFIGLAVRRFGRGIDWRFPVIAAAIAIVAAFAGSFVSALFLTGREFDTSVWSLIGEISGYTISRFATGQFGAVGTIYAGMAAAVAAFFAGRRLTRHEAIALRKHRQAVKA